MFIASINVLLLHIILLFRDEREGRGISTLQEAKLELQREEQRYLNRNQLSKEKLDRFNVAKEMLTLGGDMMSKEVKEYWYRIMSECATAIAVEEKHPDKFRTPGTTSSSTRLAGTVNNRTFNDTQKIGDPSPSTRLATADDNRTNRVVLNSTSGASPSTRSGTAVHSRTNRDGPNSTSGASPSTRSGTAVHSRTNRDGPNSNRGDEGMSPSTRSGTAVHSRTNRVVPNSNRGDVGMSPSTRSHITSGASLSTRLTTVVPSSIQTAGTILSAMRVASNMSSTVHRASIPGRERKPTFKVA